MGLYMVWYSRDFAASCWGKQKVDIKNIKETHALVKSVRAADPEEVYVKMQGEVWSPNGEARDLIESLGLKHTSMSVGDIVHDMTTGEWLRVTAAGFEKLGESEV